MSVCTKRRALLENTATWWGRMRWWMHTRRCPECAERVRTEEEMTALLQRLGSWEEPPGLAARGLPRGAPSPLVLFPPPKPLPIARQRRRWVGTWGTLTAVMLVCLLAVYRLIFPPTSDIAFADMMDLLNQQTAFFTYGHILQRLPSGTVQERQFEQTMQRNPTSDTDNNVHWKIQWSLWQSSGQNLPKRFASEIAFPTKLDFPDVLFERTVRNPQGQIVQSKLFSPSSIEEQSRYQFVFMGMPLMSREVAENLLRDPAVILTERTVIVARKPERIFLLTVRDTVGNQIQWRFHIAQRMRLPYRVQVTYRSKAESVVWADYMVDYPPFRF